MKNRSNSWDDNIIENLKMKQINSLLKDIEYYKQILITRAEKIGLYENFGDREVQSLKDKYIDISSYTNETNNMRRTINQFDDWCMNYVCQKR